MQRHCGGFHAAVVALTAATVKDSVAVQDFLPAAIHGTTDAIVVARHGSKVADEESGVGRVLGVP